MLETDEMLNFLKKIHDDLIRPTEELKFDKKSPQQLAVMSYYLSIFEFAGSCILLISSKQIIGIPILLRSIIDAYVDLVNLIQDPKYGCHLRVSFLKQSIQLHNKAKKEHPSVTLISDSELEQMEHEIKLLRNKGCTELTVEQRFKDIHIKNRLLYSIFCCDSHNNLISLTQRHIMQENFSIKCYKEIDVEEISRYLRLIAEYFVEATRLVHIFFESTEQVTIKKLIDEFNMLSNRCDEPV